MSNMIQAAREQVAALTQAAYEKAAAEGLLPAGAWSIAPRHRCRGGPCRFYLLAASKLPRHQGFASRRNLCTRQLARSSKSPRGIVTA